MAPKVKKGKKTQDDWDEDLAETTDPTAEATANTTTGDVDQDEGAGGGLMAALRKNKEKRKKKGKTTDNDWLDGEDPTDTPQVDLAEKAPVEASMEDEDAFSQPTKKGKPRTQPKQEEDDDGEDGGKIKTKAEKEKERKEREKQRKKEQAASKKKATPAPKEEEKVEAVVEEPKIEPAKKKKLNPVLAALQKQQEDLRRQQEQDANLAAEEKARLEQDEKATAEEEQRKTEQKAARKEREKKKVEEMKKAGTYKTEKQRKDEAQAKLRLQQMLESGVAKVEGADGETRKRDDRKRNPKKEAEERKREQEALEIRLKEDQTKLAEEEAEKARLSAEVETQDEEEEDELDDWEVMAEKEDRPETAHEEEPSEDEEESEDDSEDSDSDDEQETTTQRQARERKEQAHAKRQQEMEAAKAAASADNLRSPIACILGHVDTGKTKLLDKIRQTNVQDGEAGGITQQIGATYFPASALTSKTQIVNQDGAFQLRIPGLLVIDTPGHESFSNLRSRGSSLCNIAILVVDIMHGLEPQTLESMKLLRDRKTPFIVALNKIDRIYGWKPIANNGFRDSLALQGKAQQNEFRDRLEKTKLAFAEQSFNAELYYENRNMAKYVSFVPTSAHTGEGIPDMLKLLAMLSQDRMTKQLMYVSNVEATVLEVKMIEGLGCTIDIILINGILHEGDTCVICGTDGPIVFTIRALLTPGEMKELRVKSVYVHNKTVKAALGVKISAHGLDNAIAGSRLLVAKDPDDEDEIEELEEDVMSDLEGLMSRISKGNRGVFVQASTLGSLEALLEFLRASKIPVGSIGIGPVHKRDVIHSIDYA